MSDFVIGVGELLPLTVLQTRLGVVPPGVPRKPVTWSLDQAGGTLLENANLKLIPVGGNPSLDCDAVGKGQFTAQDIFQRIDGSPNIVGGVTVDIVYPFDATTAVLRT